MKNIFRLWVLASSLLAYSMLIFADTDSDESTALTITLSGIVDAVNNPAIIDPTGPSMPVIKLDVEVQDPRFSVLRVQYRLSIRYQGHGRSDVSGTYSGEGANGVRINFGNDIRGGVLQGQGNVLIRRPSGSTYWSGWQGINEMSIMGSNPDMLRVRDYIDLLPASVVAYLQSGLKMFSEDGQPDYKDGFGVARLTNPDAEQVWHWKKNSIEAKAQWMAQQTIMENYPKSLRESDPEKYKKLPDFKKKQLRLATYQAFSEGDYFIPVKRGWWFFKKWRWVKNDEVNGFADECLELQKSISAGKFPDVK